MASFEVVNPTTEWRTYKKKLELNLFKIKWNQAKAISQHTPRLTKADGTTNKAASRSLPLPSPLKLHTPKAAVSESVDRSQTRNLVAVATPYRLPKLHDHAEFSSRHKDYVFIQPLSASHFLIHKDPMRSTPVPQCVSPELRIKPNSTKCRPLTQQRPKTKSPMKPWTSGHAKSQRFLPQIKRAAGLALLDRGDSKSPHTPPQSEVEFNHLPNVKPNMNEHVTLPIPPTRGDSVIDRQKINWQLSPYSNRNFDRQGVGPNQGPFSREMPIKCTPPANWLRMKLRQRMVAGR